MTATSYRYIFSVIKSFKTDKTFFCWFAFSSQHISKISYWLLVKCCIQSLYLIFNVMYNFSTQCLPQYIFNRSTFLYANVLGTHHADDTCVLIFSVYGALPFNLVLIWFFFSLYFSLTGFNILSVWLASMCVNINGALNWYWLSWNYSHFPFSDGILTLTWPMLLQ